MRSAAGKRDADAFDIEVACIEVWLLGRVPGAGELFEATAVVAVAAVDDQWGCVVA